MRDVARHAGVSHMTVSRVVNGDQAVRPATRLRVEKAIKTLRFAPNQIARALTSAEQVRVALLHRFPNPGSLGEYLIHLLQASTRAHASLIIREITREEEDRSAVEELVEHGVRGVILPPPLGDDPALVAMLRAESMAIVTTGSTHRQNRLPNVAIDDRSAAVAMTEHLFRLGHRRIGFIKGRQTHASAALRLDGFRSALARAGVPAPEELIADGLYTYQSGLDAADRLLSLSKPPTAIFASNDDMAAATLAVAHSRGIDVPGQLAVCGFDDTPLATTIWPALTTIRQPVEALTHTAFQLLLQTISSGDAQPAEPPSIRLDHLLVRRQSDGPPPTGGSEGTGELQAD